MFVKLDESVIKITKVVENLLTLLSLHGYKDQRHLNIGLSAFFNDLNNNYEIAKYIKTIALLGEQTLKIFTSASNSKQYFMKSKSIP